MLYHLLSKFQSPIPPAWLPYEQQMAESPPWTAAARRRVRESAIALTKVKGATMAPGTLPAALANGLRPTDTTPIVPKLRGSSQKRELV